MQIGFGNTKKADYNNQEGPLTKANNALMYIAHNEKLTAGIVAGAAAAGGRFLERLNDIDSFQKSNLAITEGKQGKELVKLLNEKGLINTLPRTILIPFISVGAITMLFLYGLGKAFPKKENN